MKNTILKKIFEFLEKTAGEKTPLKWKIINDFDSINGDDLVFDDNLDLFQSSAVKLPNNLTVIGYLDIRVTDIKELPDNLTVHGQLLITGLEIDSIPNNLKASSIYAKGTSLSEKYSYKEIADMIKEKGGKFKLLSI
ncbi:MAG: hypothetical protein K9I82_04305 [Chitinophagaceae bacterium]|nr:hypothetical protein [Chitinophagaceae bacterium]